MAPSSVVVTIEKANGLSVVEVNDSSSSPFTDKQKSGNAKVFAWVLLLKAHRALGCIPWLARTSCNTFASVKKRITNSNINDEEPKYGGRLYRFIKIFLVSFAALVIEILAYFNQWHLSLVHLSEVQDIVQWSYMAWQLKCLWID
ncbi:hypothetical protein LIER_37617 [Lithospermum erythrorhizon]|uniref:Uncharacterized protein n=1 Tax=Lithospermum erythrorhizon TaxID=34254 RepID=A0AAV3PQ68_LITER